MRLPLVQVSPISYSGSARIEVATFLAHCAAWHAKNSDTVRGMFIHPVVNCTPAPMARNLAVKKMWEADVDILVMVDDDMIPANAFFETAIKFLMDQPEPSVIASPYCGAPPLENVMVFNFVPTKDDVGEKCRDAELVRREDAAQRTGIGRVPNIGTGLIAYDARVFSKIQPPYYDYVYSGDHSRVFETEDCFTNRRLNDAGVPIYCDWDHWSGHWKAKRVDKPRVKD